MIKMHHKIYLFLIALCLPFFAMGGYTSAYLADTVQPPWDQISLTSEKMKPGIVLEVQTEKSGISLWIPITGGTIAGGLITYFILTDEDDEPDPDQEPLVVTDDVYTIPCGMSQSLDVLNNDSGDGIQIINATTTNGEVQIINNSQLQITALFTDQVVLTYIVEDANGNTAEGRVDLIVSFPTIEAIDDTYTTDFETAIEENVLNNDNGTQLNVIDNTQPTSGQLTILADGSFTYIPNPGFSGQDQFQYTIEDKCAQQKIAFVTINVNDQLCDYELTVETAPSDCGIANGTAMVTVTPDGIYEFKWSDDSSGAHRTDLKKGFYTLEVVREDGCSKETEVEITSRPPHYNISLSTEPGNCEGGGEISISTETAGQGPMIIMVNGPNDTMTLEVPAGQEILLSDFMNVLPGTYGLIVYDQGAGEACAEIVLTEVEDQTPELIAINDSFTTSFRTPLDGNLTNNDKGLSIIVTSVDNIIGGSVEFSENGQFTFTPDNDFLGEASFVYTITDACGKTTTARVVILVEQAECEFTAEFEVANASCGSSDGAATIAVEPPGNYSYTWSDGTNGAMIMGVQAGTYHVTVMDNDLQCSLEFAVDIDEDAADFIHDTTIIQPVCGEEGDIILELQSNAGPPYLLGVTHSGSTERIFVNNNGPYSLSSSIEVLPGNYIIDVRNLNLPAYCQQSLQVTINASFTPMIAIEGVIPPSSPSANDGSIIVFIEQLTNAPYQVFVNREVHSLTSSEVFTISELTAGFYEIFIVDANGCMSNTVSVELEPDGLMRFEYVQSQAPHLLSDLFTDQAMQVQNIYPLQLVGLHWTFINTPATPYINIHYGSTNYQGVANLNICSFGTGLEQTVSWGGISFTPRMGFNLQLNHWQASHLEHLDLQLSPVFQTDFSMPLNGNMKIFSRSTLRGSIKMDWNMEFGVRMK